MISSESRRDSMHRFGSRLMKLEPNLNAVNAAQHAAAAYDKHASGSEPRGAAATFATERAGVDFAGGAAPARRNAQTVARRRAD